MKVKCKVEVQDKYTGEWYKANNEYDLPEERAAEVVKAYDGRYFEFVEEAKEEEKPKRVRKSTKK
jgi:hypothetical protein